MSSKKYNYNPKTLSFERKKISPLKVLTMAVAFFAFGLLFFVGLLFLQNYFVESPFERQLRTENSELKRHKKIVSDRIQNVNSQLERLQVKDDELYKKIFEIPKESSLASNTDSKEDILIASSPAFASWTSTLSNEFEKVAGAAKRSNSFFRLTASVNKKDWNRLQATPALQPIENFKIDQLVSGFGVRINPFHKGKYHHDGVDIAAARGANVVASGPGMITAVKKSDLMAGFGNYVEVDHGFGYITRYAHLEEIHVRVGQKVLKGFVIGTVGTSGGSIAPHLHYEVILEGKNVDPVQFMIQGLDSDGYAKLYVASKKVNQSLD